MRQLIVILLVVCGAVGASAQNFSADLWHQGELRLNDNSYVKGQVKYDLEHDAVRIKRNGKIETYAAQQVASFRIVDARTKAFRNFFTLPYANKTGHKRPKLFEVIVEGKATLLAREFITTISNSRNNVNRRGLGNNRFGNGVGNSGLRNPALGTRQILAHKMFIVNLDGNIREVTARKRDLFYILKGHDTELKKFIKKRNLKLSKVRDMAHIVGHFNGISTEQTKAH